MQLGFKEVINKFLERQERDSAATYRKKYLFSMIMLQKNMMQQILILSVY